MSPVIAAAQICAARWVRSAAAGSSCNKVLGKSRGWKENLPEEMLHPEVEEGEGEEEEAMEMARLHGSGWVEGSRRLQGRSQDLTIGGARRVRRYGRRAAWGTISPSLLWAWGSGRVRGGRKYGPIYMELNTAMYRIRTCEPPSVEQSTSPLAQELGRDGTWSCYY
jgi:hypothetical protein